MPSPRFERVQELFRQRAEIEAEIESLLMGGSPKSEEYVTNTSETAPGKKPCGCSIRGRSKARCRICNPDQAEDSDDETGYDHLERIRNSNRKPCGCHITRSPKRSCLVCAKKDPGEDPNDQQSNGAFDEELRPLKRYKCIECGREVESRQHRLDLTCAPPMLQ